MGEVEGKSSGGIISIEKAGSQLVTMDREGRIIYYSDGTSTWKRSLADTYIRIGWDGENRIAEAVGSEEGKEISGHAYTFLKDVAPDLRDEKLRDDVNYILGKGSSWVTEDSERMGSLYGGSFPIIPQDQGFSLYVQLSRGFKWNNSTFAAPSGEARILDEEALRTHIKNVKESMGRGLDLRKGVFLGDAGALSTEQKELLRALDIVKEETGLPVYSFVDVFTIPRKKNMIHYQDMKRHGLSKVYVGIQSGSVSLLRQFEKLKNVSDIINLVNNLKSNGINVGIIVLTGYGGNRYSAAHVEETATIMSQMDLDQDDIIYLSPMDENDDPRYMELVDNGTFDIMNAAGKKQQADQLEKSIREEFLGSNRAELKTQISRYDMREGVY